MIKIDHKNNDFIIKIFNLPMCPTANRLLMPSRGRLISTPEKRIWESEVNIFSLRNRNALLKAQKIIHEFISLGDPYLSVDLYHCFCKEKLFSKQNKVKKIDSNNRMKASIDAISNLLSIDDMYFFEGQCKKIISHNKNDFTVAVIKNTKLYSYKELFDISF